MCSLIVCYTAMTVHSTERCFLPADIICRHRRAWVAWTLLHSVRYARNLVYALEHARGTGMNSVFHLGINGAAVEVLAPVHKTFLEVRRADLQLTGTRHGCELGEGGTCIDTATQLAFRPTQPLDNTKLTPSYRKKMVRVHVTRVLRQSAGLSVAPHR